MIRIGDDKIRSWRMRHLYHADITAGDGIANKRLRFKVLVNRNSGSVATLKGPRDVTEYMVRFVCDRLETWRFGVRSLKWQNGTAEITLQSAVVWTRQVKTILRNTPWYSHGSLGHCECAVKEVEKQIRVIVHTLVADKCASDRHVFAMVRLAQPEQFGEHLEEQWNLDSVKAVLIRSWDLKVSTKLDTSAVRPKYITNQVLDKHGRAPLCTRCALGTEAHSSECRARFEIIWTKELAGAEITSRAADSVPSGPDVREIGSLEFTEATGQPVEMEGVSTDQVVERAGGASPQLDEEQVQPMDVSLDQSVTASATKRRAETQLTLNSVEGYTGGLRSFDGRQAEQAQEVLAMVVAKDEFSVDTIDDDSHQYDHYTGKLLDRDKYIAEREKELDQVEAYCVIRRVKKSEAIDVTHVRMK